MSDIIIPGSPIVFEDTLEEGCALVAFLKPSACDCSEFINIVKPNNVIAVDDDKNLPVYPSVTDFIYDVVESDFNPDIDKTLHFTSEDLPNIVVWKCKVLGDLRDTAHSTIKLAYAIMLLSPMNMERLRADIKLAAAKYGKPIEKENEESISDIAATILNGVH